MKTVQNFILKSTFILAVLVCCSVKSIGATFTVTDNTWQDVTGSLLWSLNQANASAGPHIINFDLAGAPYTILPTGTIILNQEIIIDGSTSGQLVELDGTGAVNTHGILIGTAGANSEIRGLSIENYDFHGVFILNSNSITIGGDRNLGYGNVISGNGQSGITIEGSFDNTIQGNYIGIDQLGMTTSANGQNGVNIYGTASTNNLIGGDRTLGFGNVISGNGFNGIDVSAGTYTITGNYVGISADGILDIGNDQNGLRITTTEITNNVIGGNDVGLRNVISGNDQNGIFISGGTHTIWGNYIGTNANGDAALGNTQNGLLFASTTTNNIVGGSNTTNRNIISGNIQNGLRIEVGTHIIRGNYIGTDVTGAIALGNTQNGINFVATDAGNLVGGLAVGDGNIISGNTEVGIRSDNTTDLMIFGNIIGLDALGINDLGNGQDGIYGSDGSNNHQIGGATVNHRNVISGNGRDGVFYERTNQGLLVQNNYIGTDINGTAGVGALGNGRNGVFVNISTTNSTFSDNVISGNGLLFTMGQNNGNGIMAFDSPINVITNNIIGLEADGITTLGNFENGINLINSSDVSITANTVSSNGSWQADATATGETPFAGLLPLGHGVILNGSSNATIHGNRLGVDITGEGDYGNLQSGLVLLFGDNYTIGTSDLANRNIIGNNLEFGIHIILTGGNVAIQNNYIGQSTSGGAVGNDGGGIYVNSTSNVIIGGTGVNEPNVIANTTGDNLRFANGCGVCIDGDGSTAGVQNIVSQNSITCNVGLGIDLDKNGDMYDKWSTRFWPDGGTTVPTPGEGNIGKEVPTVDPYRTSATTVTGTGEIGDEIQLFDNSCDCEGETYLTTTTVDADGTWEAIIPSVADSSFITAIAIDANNNTSEFTSCCRVQSDSLEAVSESICIGGSVTLNLSFHVGTDFQLQSSNSETGPWANEGAAHVYEDSTWTFTPSASGTTFYRVYSSSASWGGTAATPATCNDSTEVVEITVSSSITADAPSNVERCDSFELPILSVGNYFTETNQGGVSLTAGEQVKATDVIYVYAGSGSCTDENMFTVTINTSPEVTDLVDQIVCDSYELPVITGTNLTGSEGYFTATGGGGTGLAVGSIITGTTTFYIYDETQTTPNCVSDEEVTITISNTPNVTDLKDTIVCDNYELPIITGTSLTGNEGYFTMTNGGGTELAAGSSINTTTTLYIYDETQTMPNCTDEEEVIITVNNSPVISLTSTNPTVCTATDGSITLTGLIAGTVYSWTYTDPDATVVSNTGTANSLGELLLSNNLKAGSYTAISVSLNGCISNIVSVNLNDPNAPTINAGVDQRECFGTSITLNATATSGATIDFDNSVSNGVSFLPAVGDVRYTATATLDGCTSSDVVRVIIDALPVLNINTPATICSPNTVDLTDAAILTGSTDLGQMTYWQDASATIVYSTSTTASAGTYYIKSENVNNNTCSAISEIVVSIDAQPSLTISSPLPVCSPGTVDLTAPAITAGSIESSSLTYWTDQDATNSYTSPTQAVDGTYFIVAENGVCSDTQSVIVTITDTPVITSVHTNPSNCGISDGSITLSGLVSGTTYSLEYKDPLAIVQSSTNTADASGQVVLSNTLTGGEYIEITATLNSCVSNVLTETLVTPGAPSITSVDEVNTSTCSGEEGEIEITASPLGNLEYSINGGAFQSSNVFTGLAAGTYTTSVRYSDGTCVEPGQLAMISDPTGTPFDLEGIAPTCEGESGKMYVDGPLNSTADYSIRFTDNTNSQLNASLFFDGDRFEISPYETGEYTNFVLLDDKNCESTNDTIVEIGAIIDTCTLDPVYAPNVFTPDGDGLNETFVIYDLSRFGYSNVEIFNRWGSLVYSSFSYWTEPWDGGNAPDGVYFFIVEYGENQDEVEAKSGVVHLLR